MDITKFAIIITLISTTSPIITSLISAFHETKIRKIELEREHYKETVLYKRDIFENYLKYLNATARVYEIPENNNQYSHYYPLAYLYAPIELREKMVMVNKLIDEKEYVNLSSQIEEITSMISDIL